MQKQTKINQILLDDILNRVDSLVDQEAKDELKESIAKGYALAGKYTESLSVANTIKDDLIKEIAYSRVIDEMITNGLYQDAINVLNDTFKIFKSMADNTEAHINSILLKIAFDKLNKDKIDEVIEDLDKITSEDSRNVLIIETINKLLGDKKIQQAENFLDKIKGEGQDIRMGITKTVKDVGRMNIIGAKAKYGNIDEAIKEAESFGSEANRLEALLLIAFINN